MVRDARALRCAAARRRAGAGDLARRQGFPLIEFNAAQFARGVDWHAGQPYTADWQATYGCGGDIRIGTLLRQPDLAATYRAIAAAGPASLRRAAGPGDGGAHSETRRMPHARRSGFGASAMGGPGVRDVSGKAHIHPHAAVRGVPVPAHAGRFSSRIPPRPEASRGLKTSTGHGARSVSGGGPHA